MKDIVYNKAFYENMYLNTRHAAQVVFDIVLPTIPLVECAVDVGCGVGTWLHVLGENIDGVKITGVDGDWVPAEIRKINRNQFIEFDLSQVETYPNLPKKNLVISLEVAEHLPAQYANRFVDYLASLGDFIIFSAAIPFQGGVDHFNEQWPAYWANLFGQKNMVLIDCIRPLIWEDKSIPVWYKQNIFLVANKDRLDNLKGIKEEHINSYPSLVHPEAWKGRVAMLEHSIQKLERRSAFKMLRRQLKQSVKNIFKR